MTWTFHPDDLDSADVQALLHLHFEAMRASSPRDACHVLPVESLRAPDISFWSSRENGRLLGVGALKALPPDGGEIKSMRIAPEALGRGVGWAMLRHITKEAQERGYRHLSLETGRTERFRAALALYERAGFIPCPAFGAYSPSPFTVFLTKAL